MGAKCWIDNNRSIEFKVTLPSRPKVKFSRKGTVDIKQWKKYRMQ